MSRSRRAGVYTQGYGGKGRKSSKRAANKRVKHISEEDTPIRAKGAYKRKYNSWDICDWKFKTTDTKAKRK